jgi:ribose transport system ATP-binding protein
MARALSHDVRLIIMDEPSAALDPDEVDNLFRIVKDLTTEGVAVVYISHQLEEIRRIGDRVSVLKDGRVAARDLPARTTPTSELVARMTGRDVQYAFPRKRGMPNTGAETGTDETGTDETGTHETGTEKAGTGKAKTGKTAGPGGASSVEPVLAARGLARKGEFEAVDLELRPGEIVGLAGLVGSGRSELLETLYGARRPTAGRVLVDGQPLRPGSIVAAVRAGIGLAPEERKSQALLMLESVTRNVSLSSLPRFSRGGWLDRVRERADAHRHVSDLALSPDDPERPVSTLSGGNQQKAVLARWLLRGCRVLLLDEPTRGVDVGARAELYAVVRRLADSGVCVLLVSSELPEVLGLADRVLVLREGRVVHEAPAHELDEHRVLDLVMEGGPA